MIRFLAIVSVLMVCSGCAHNGGRGGEDIQYLRVEYFETVFQPASEACRKAGGFMIFEDLSDGSGRNARLSYADMRLAVARGCAGT
jgi:hypothetical protein